MRITIHRGNQIGGCITEIVSSMGTRIFVDLGHNLPKGDEESEDEFASEEAIADLIGDARAIFYTHMHGDHVELFQYVPDGVDQYIGPLALNIMKAKYEHMSHAEALKENSDKCLRKLEPFKTYRKGRPIAIDDITVTPFQVSHSSADSYMLKIKCDGKTILHTGDFRGHGYMGEGIYKVVDKYHIAGHVDILITEGTNVDNNGKSMRPESALKEEFKEVFRQYKNTFIICSSTDADRLESIYSANKESAQRPFIADTYQKDIIGLIAQQAEEGRRLYHFGPNKIYGYSPTNEKMDYMMRRYGFVMLIRRSEKFQSYLYEILPFCKPEETCLVYSQYHGYIEKREGNTAFNQELFDYVEQFREKSCTIKDRIHTSGHVSKQDLVRLCELINPALIIPIHKDEKADFVSILPDELKMKVCEYEYSKDGIDIEFDPPQGTTRPTGVGRWEQHPKDTNSTAKKKTNNNPGAL